MSIVTPYVLVTRQPSSPIDENIVQVISQENRGANITFYGDVLTTRNLLSPVR